MKNRKGIRLVLGAMLTALILAPGASGWEIPLTVQNSARSSVPPFISGGVPLLPGQAKETAELHLGCKDASGLIPVPAQFRVLARWWRADNSIRWVLVDFQTELKGNEKQTFVLTDKKLNVPAPKHKLIVSQTDDAITVNTGAATFVINRKRFGCLQSVTIDGEELLATTPECGTVIEDAFGKKYYSSESTRSVEVIEQGLLRARVRARGVHRSPGGQGYSKGMYRYDYLMDFYAGATTVFCDVIISNNFPKSVGTPCFEDASLVMRLKHAISDYSIAGHAGAPHAGKLTPGESVCLYQDSNGAETWKQCQGYNTEQRDYWRFPADKTASFRGYKVWQRSAGTAKEIAHGEQASGTTHVRTARGGLVIHLRNFWQQFPKGVEVFGDGRFRLALFPREYKVNHFLEDATAKGHEIALHFYTGRSPDPTAIAVAWESKVLPRPADIRHIGACGALADIGSFSVPTEGLSSQPTNRTAAYHLRMLTADGLYGNAYGWQVFGEKWRSCGGHSSRGARQPMNEDNYLYRWFVTGVPGWFLNGDARSRHFRDVRSYRIEDVDPFSYKDWDHFRANNRSEDWTRRPQPEDAEPKKYSAGRYPRSTFWLPNPAHMVMDLLYDRYLLMGDQRSFENMRIIGAHGGYYAAYRPPTVHRATGWSWRALFRYWELTGDHDAEKLLGLTIQNYKNMVGGEIEFPMVGRKEQKDGTITYDRLNWWFTFVFCRAAAMTALHTGDPDALLVCRKMAEAIEPMKKKWPKGYDRAAFAEFYGVLYHLSGEERYKKLGLGKDDGKSLKRVTGGMFQPAAGHWLLSQNPKPLK